MRTLCLLPVSLLVAAVVCGQGTPNPPNRLLIEHVTLIDSTGSPPTADACILVEGIAIKAIDSCVHIKPSPGVRKVNAKGKFLIAGLWDMHVHALSGNHPDRFFPLFVANGVTGIRDMGGDIPLPQVTQLKKEIATGSRLGPEIFAAGPILEGEHPFWPFSLAVKDQAGADLAVSKLVQEQADFLKVYTTLSREAYLEIAKVANQDHIAFVGHVPDSVTPTEASDLGQKSIEHLWGILRFTAANPEELKNVAADADNAEDPAIARDLYYRVNQAILSTHDSKKADALFAKFVHNHTWQTPTLVVLRSYASIHDPKLRRDPRTGYMPDDLLKFWNSMGGKPDSRNDEIQQRLFGLDIKIVKAIHAAGVPLLAGTDTPNPFTYPGFSLHEELQLLVSAGESPMEALQTATIRAAQFLGVDGVLGSVETGKIANLILLDANPLDDIRNTQRIRAVVLRGRFLDRSSLDSLLAAQKYPHTRAGLTGTLE